MIPLLLAIALAPASRSERMAGDAVLGQVRSAGERAPVASARVFARQRRGDAWTREAVTNAAGEFILADLPTRDFILTIVAPGHERLEQPTPAAFWSRRKPPTIYLQPLGSTRYRTTVTQERNPRPAVVRTQLSPEELAKLPGSQGDPLRALQNLPGVARIPGGLGLLVLRGASPNQSQVFYGEHPLPRAFHIPGLASVVPGAALGGIQYMPSNFDSGYGNAVGGVVVMTPRVGRRDGIHGHAKVDIVSAGALVEGPLRRGSFLIAGQRGYLDLALQALGKDVLGSNFIRPRYYDYQIVFDHPAGPGATVTTRFIGASDELRYPYGNDGDFLMHQSFHRLDLAYRNRSGAWDLLLAPAVRLDRGGIESSNYWRRRNDVIGFLRLEATGRLSRRFRLTIGADTQVDRFSTRVEVAQDSIFLADSAGRGISTTSGLYITPQLTVGDFSVSPGLRVNAFTGGGGGAFAVDPRLIARWSPHERVSLHLGAGLYSMPTLPTAEQGSSLLFGNGGNTTIRFLDKLVLPGALGYLDARIALEPYARVRAGQALQLSAGFHARLTDTLGLDATYFYRRAREPVTVRVFNNSVPQLFSYENGSVTQGLEVLLRKDLSGRFFGWIAYTLMRSQAGGFDVSGRLHLREPGDFDQRHNFVALVGVKLPRRWELGARFRVVTGLPYTPVIGSVASESPPRFTYPIYGETNAARLGTFHQLDIRVDRTWVYKRTIVAAYVDIQNLYNRQNPEGMLYSDDFKAVRAVVGVPILPVVGVHVKY